MLAHHRGPQGNTEKLFELKSPFGAQDIPKSPSTIRLMVVKKEN
jgi:hypothetical protein